MSASLKTRIMLVVSLLVTLLLSVMAFVSLSYFDTQYKEIISRYQYSVVTEMAETIDEKLQDTKHIISLLASNLSPGTISDPAAVRRFLSAHPYSSQIFDNGIFLLSPRGKILGGSIVEPHMHGEDYSFRDYYRKTVETGKPCISEPFESTQLTKHPIIVFTAPVFDGKGKLAAILCGSLDLMKDNFLGRLAGIKLGDKGYLYLYNTSRTLIVHKDRERILKRDVPPGANRLFDLAIKGFEGTGETITSRGLATLSSFRHLKTTDWILASNYPRTEAYAPIYRAKKYLLAGLAAVLLLSIFVVRFFMERLTAPLINFTGRVREMTRSEAAVEPIAVQDSASEEIATLGQVFNTMLAEMEQRKQAERGQLDFLHILLDTMPNPVFFKDREGKYIGCNRAMEEMIGVKRADMVGKTVHDFLPKEVADKHSRAEEKLMGQEGSQLYESQLELADGAMHDLLFYKAAFPGPDGTPAGVIATIVDITERRRAEFELAEHAEFAVNLVQNSTVPTFVLDASHAVIIWNRACEELTGVKAYNVVGSRDIGKVFYGYNRKILADFIVDGNLEGVREIYSDYTRSSLIPQGIQAERWFSELNGRERYLSFTAAPIENSSGELIAVIQTLEDNTGQKLAMEQLQESETRMRAILDTAADGIITIDGEGNINSVNRSCEAMFGYDHGALDGRNISMILPSFRLEGEFDPVNRRFRHQDIGTSRLETDACKSDGSVFPVELALSEVQLGNRRLFTGIITDITERKRGEEKMQWTLSLLGATLESTADGILVVDGSEKVVRFNRKFLEMWRIPESVMESLDDREVLSFVQGQLINPGAFLSRIRELYGDPGAESYDVLEFLDGRIFERFSNPQMIGDSIIGRVWSFRDVTEQRKLEAQLRHSQKMEALGTLAGGVAHDFNNMLTAIIGFSSLIQMNMDKADPNLHYLNQVLAAAERAAGLTQSLLAYSRKEPINPGRHDLNGIVRKVVKLLSRLIGEDIELVIALDDTELAIMADSGQIEQVLMNLATNARDAIPGEGKLLIITNMAELTEEFVRGHGYGKSGKYVHIRVSDTGIGMEKATMERIFEPFFTTKQLGRGTGLGLSIVYGIVKQLDGYITVSSEQDKGTSFDIYFPVVASADKIEETIEEEEIAGGTETLLVVEDSPEIREYLSQVLSGAGYTVIEAVDGQDGVEKFIEHRNEVRLLVLDVIMPRKNGREAYEEIRAINDGVKVIFTSGYTAEIISRQGLIAGEFNFLAKPLSPHTILAKVRQTLDG